MRFSTLIVVIIFLGLISISVHDAMFWLKNLDAKVRETHSCYAAKSFIAQSFKNTCEGKGFESLEQWQLCCRAMFGLEYIAWCPAENFMIDKAAENGKPCLMYGKWEGSGMLEECSGEVFYRSGN